MRGTVSAGSSVTYSPYNKKFYLGALNLEKGADFTHADQIYTPIAKYNE